jgi:hypothetical protein
VLEHSEEAGEGLGRMYATEVPTGYVRGFERLTDSELVRKVVRGPPVLLSASLQWTEVWGEAPAIAGWWVKAVKWEQEADDSWGIEGFFIERTSYEDGVQMTTTITAEQLREAMEELKRDPSPVMLWLTTEDHGERGLTGVDGFVKPLLRYWQQHDNPPQDVKDRLKSREMQEAEQERERVKRKTGKGKTIWKQAKLPI